MVFGHFLKCFKIPEFWHVTFVLVDKHFLELFQFQKVTYSIIK